MTTKPRHISLFGQARLYATLGYGWEDIAVKLKINETDAKSIVLDWYRHNAAFKKALGS